MRRGRGKLSPINWTLVLLAGIFQMLTLIFDQIVIQYEEELRKSNYEIITKSESRSAYLKMNNSSKLEVFTKLRNLKDQF